MAWLPRYRVCKAEPRLRGLVVTEQKTADDPPVGTTYPWAQIEYFGKARWTVYDEQGQHAKHHGLFLSLRGPEGWVLGLAGRLQRRALHRALADGTLVLTDACRLHWLERWLFLGCGAALAIGLGPLVLTILIRLGRDEQWLSGDWLVLFYAVMIAWPALVVGMTALFVTTGITILIRPNAHSARFDAHGVHAILTDGTPVYAAWSNIVAIKRKLMVTQLCFNNAPDLWLPNLTGRSLRLFSIIEELYLPPHPKPDPFAPRRLLISGLLLGITSSALTVWLLHHFKLRSDALPPFVIGAIILLFLSFPLLVGLVLAPRLTRWGYRRSRRKVRSRRHRGLLLTR